MKPDAPAEIRGPYKQISTNVPGTFVCEHLPRCAQVADKYTILRSHSHKVNGHSTGYHYMLTGYPPDFRDGENPVPNNDLYPSIGSIVARELGPGGKIPPYINVPDPMAGGGPGFFGAEYAPFVIESDPVQPDFEVKDLQPAAVASRMDRRRRFLSGLETLEKNYQGRAGQMATYYDKAFELVTSRDAKQAFDLNQESDALRQKYGHSSLGQCALLSRRLVESGCRFVGIDNGSWDTHFDCFPTLENDLFPDADRAFSALVTDLEERGLLDDTLVVMMGEMGRTPRVNNRAGRDHWSMAQSVILAGGGIKPGMIVGATDGQAAAPTTEPVSVQDLIRTFFTLLGINSDKMYHTPLGRPVPLVNGGRVVSELFA